MSGLVYFSSVSENTRRFVDRLGLPATRIPLHPRRDGMPRVSEPYVLITPTYGYGDDPLKRKVASTLLSSLLLYAGFYLPLHFSTHALLTNTADMVRLILRDKAVHGYYSGYTYQRGLEGRTPAGQEEMRAFTYELLEELYELELRYSGELYEPLGLMDDVAVFVRYNADKALMNLGYPARFGAAGTEVNPEILAALSPGADENHDFFSGSGSSYVMGKAEDTSDDDWDF
ncbi:ribonucleotide-diphosphate reductase subunit beta [Streptomyces sp. NPDC015131]|uniref:ribonucleotide-diphosphate reductase subunit beta n=1 Tax=Streptomyces sp. NPDC015131 TaxID=3364941 RepID=UPI0036FADE66